MTTVEVNIGGPATLNVVGARRGSRWLLPLTFSEDLDLSPVTGGTLVLKPYPGGDDTTAALSVDLNVAQKASGVITATASKTQTAAIAAGRYLWEMQFAASDPSLDGWAPLAGSWDVDDRQTA